MAAETGFLIDGQLYEMPTRDSFDLDEWQVMYDCARLTLNDFLGSDDEEAADEEEEKERAEKFRSPGVWRALIQIAYQRGHPELSAAKVKARIGTLNMLDALSGLIDPEEADAEIPPASTTEPEPSSSNDSVVNESSTPPSSESSTAASTSALAPLAVPPARIGASRSDTSSITRGEISAA